MKRHPVIPPRDLAEWADRLRAQGKKIVFTNGCFDLLHPGHIALLREASGLGDALIVGINSDASVKRLKGGSRPVFTEMDRAEILMAVRWVDAVTIFAEDTPLETIRKIRPDFLVKGSEYGKGEIVGEEFVNDYGGTTVRVAMRPGHASSAVIERIESSGDPEASGQ